MIVTNYFVMEKRNKAMKFRKARKGNLNKWQSLTDDEQKVALSMLEAFEGAIGHEADLSGCGLDRREFAADCYLDFGFLFSKQ